MSNPVSIAHQMPDNAVLVKVLLKGMSREIPPLRLDADALFGIQPNCLNVHSRFENGLAQGRVAYFVPACEAQERFLFPVVPYPCRDGAIRF
jgi:hypothetical protein